MPENVKMGKEIILLLYNSELSLQRISDKIKRAETVILSFLKNPFTYDTIKSIGRLGILWKRSERLIVHTRFNIQMITKETLEAI